MHRVEYLLWLKHMGISSNAKLLPALEYFSSPEELYAGDREAYEECGMFSGKEIEYLLNKDMTFVKEEIERCNSKRIYLVDYYSKAYPEALREIPEPPLILYVAGDKSILNTPSVTVVGSRKADSYGITLAQEIAAAFSQGGFTVVSGLAEGIDRSAALGAMNAGGKTVGVLCAGMDVDYPAQSRDFKNKIITSGGAVISEFEFGTPALSGYFPIRNRIMAGLSDLTVVVQAGEKSGALITARHALAYGKKVAAVPGRIDIEESRGCFSLIEEGASMLWDIPSFCTDYVENYKKKDIKEVIKEEKPIKKAPGKTAVRQGENESDNMIELCDLLKSGPKSPSQLSEISGRSIKWVSSSLIILEVSGKVKMLPDGKYSVC